MNEPIITYGGYALTYGVGGPALTVTAPAIPPLTYRFRFESPQTAADLAGVGQNGTWNRLSDYVWDFTCDSEQNPWYRNFYYGWHNNGLLPDCHLVGASTTSSDDLWETFDSQVNLKSVYIHEASLTGAFYGCTSLTDFKMDIYHGSGQLILPYSENIEFGVFDEMELQAESCKSLHISELPGTDYSNQNLRYVGSAQDPCTIIIDAMPLATTIATMFQGNESVATVYLGDTRSLRDSHNAFYGCSNLTQVHIDDTSNVIDTSQMFEGCTSLRTCPTFDLSSCSNMNHMFSRCTALMTCPDFPINNGLLGSAGFSAVEFMYSSCTGLNEGAFDWYYKLTGDTDAYRAAYGHLPPDPDYQGPFTPDNNTSTFYRAQSDEVGWPYIPVNTWR